MAEVTRELVLKDGGRCAIGPEHEHPNVAECFEHGHRIYRVDDMGRSPLTAEARFQHGENPEHSLVLPLFESPSAPCAGIAVDEWVEQIHRRPKPVPETLEGRDA